MVLMGALLLLTAIPAVFYFPAQRFILQPDAITEAILASDLSKQIPDWVAAWMADGSGIAPTNGATYLDRLDQSAYRDIISIVAPPDWTSIQSAVIARQAQDFLLGNTDALTITIDLTGVKDRLAGEALPVVAERIVSSWQSCTADNLAELALVVATGSSTGSMPFCQPPAELRPLMLRVVENGIQQFASQMPASLSFNIGDAAGASMKTQIVRFIARTWPWTPWVTLGLALFALLASGGSLRVGLMGIGIPLSLAGIIDAGVALVMVAMRESTIVPWLAGWIGNGTPVGLADLLTPALMNVTGRFFLSAMVWSGAAIVLGLALIVISRLAKR